MATRQISRETLVTIMGEMYWAGFNAAEDELTGDCDDLTQRQQFDKLLRTHRLDPLSDAELKDILEA